MNNCCKKYLEKIEELEGKITKLSKNGNIYFSGYDDFPYKSISGGYWSLSVGHEKYIEWLKDDCPVIERKHEIQEHRYIMQKMISQDISGKIVHHKDHNKLNNDPANLQLMTRSEHGRLHGRQKPREINKTSF